MAENIRTTPLRIRPSEYRSILAIGDLAMAVISLIAALYAWGQYNLYVYDILYAQYIAQDIAPRTAERLAEAQTVFTVPFWFYLLPAIWMLLLVEIYEPHVASSGKRTSRGIAIAALLDCLPTPWSLSFNNSRTCLVSA
jgi:hypothetical protein